MENETKKCKQKIEKWSSSSLREDVLWVSQKEKKTLFEDAKKFATQTGADVAVMLFSPGGKPYSCGSTSVEDIIENFLKMKVADPRRHYAEGESKVLRNWKIFIKNCKLVTRKKKNEY